VGTDILHAVIVGAGPAGLEAALMLGRARRRVLVCDAGPTRNARAGHAHGFLTRDGVPPAELLGLGRADLARYPTVEIRAVAATDAARQGDTFTVTVGSGDGVRTRGIIVAAGVRDVLPDLPGLAGLWGSGVFTCPYCHAFELRGEPLAVRGADEHALHVACLLKCWSDRVTVLPDGAPSPRADVRERFAANGISVREGRIVRLEGDDGLRRVVLDDGTAIECRGLVYKCPTVPNSDLPTRLGAAHRADGCPALVDAYNQTTVPGLYVAGDMASSAASNIVAAESGAAAAIGLNDLLAMRDAGLTP
jgi:thioredoxin reductase